MVTHLRVVALVTIATYLAVFQAGGVSAFYSSRTHSQYKGSHPGSSSVHPRTSSVHPGTSSVHPGYPGSSSVHGKETEQDMDCCPCADPEQEVQLNCEKAITKFETRAVVEDEAQFYLDLDARLQVEHCHPKHLMECIGQPFDETFQAVQSHVEQRCNDHSEADALMQLVKDYCSSHSADEAVTMAYTCKLDCRLADHLNQVCHNMKLVPVCPAGITLSAAKTCLSVVAESVFGTPIYDFVDAQERCQNFGFQLPRLDSAEEEDAVLDLFSNTITLSDGVWIGLTDRVTEEDFLWEVTSDPLTGYTDWRLGNVEFAFNTPENDCVGLFPLRWLVKDCDSPEATLVVCEASVELVLVHQ